MGGFQDGTEIQVTASKRRKDRTMPQNAYYFGVVVHLIAEHTGHTSEEVHEVLKRKFLKRQIITYRGREYAVPGSTATLSTVEFGEYLDRCIAEAGELGIVIPPPDGINL